MQKIGVVGAGLHLNHLVVDDLIDKPRGIILIGTGMKDREHIEFARELAEEKGFKIIEFENESGSPQAFVTPKLTPTPLTAHEPFMPQISFQNYPETRRERRARERKNKKKR